MKESLLYNDKIGYFKWKMRTGWQFWFNRREIKYTENYDYNFYRFSHFHVYKEEYHLAESYYGLTYNYVLNHIERGTKYQFFGAQGGVAGNDANT